MRTLVGPEGKMLRQQWDPLHEEAYMTVQIELSFHKCTLNIFYFNSHQNNYQDLQITHFWQILIYFICLI